MIGPGKALDPDKYFIICTDAIGNGLTTSPSNSKASAAHAISELRHPRHGGIAISAAEGKIRHRSCRGGHRPFDGRHANLAMGREPPRLYGRPGRHRAACENAGLERGGGRSLAQGDHGRSGLEGRQLRCAAGEGRAAVARHRQPAGGAHAGNVFGAVQEPHRRPAMADRAGERHDEGVRRQ